MSEFSAVLPSRENQVLVNPERRNVNLSKVTDLLDEGVGKLTEKWFNFSYKKEQELNAVVDFASDILNGDHRSVKQLTTSLCLLRKIDNAEAEATGEQVATYVDLTKKVFAGEAEENEAQQLKTEIRKTKLPEGVKRRFNEWIDEQGGSGMGGSGGKKPGRERWLAKKFRHVMNSLRRETPNVIKNTKLGIKAGAKELKVNVKMIGFRLLLVACLGALGIVAIKQVATPPPIGASEAAEAVTFDEAGRQARYLKYTNLSEPTIIDAWGDNVWQGYSADNLLDHLNPNNTYNSILAFTEFCQPTPIDCWTDPNLIPEGGRSVVAELLGLTRQEYDDYHNNPTPENRQKIINKLHAKYDNLKDENGNLYDWVAPLFESSPTNLSSNDKSGFEEWWEKYHKIGKVDIHSQIARRQQDGEQWKTPWKGQRSTASVNKGRGFGTTKGFS